MSGGEKRMIFMKSRFFKGYFVLMLSLVAFISFETRGLTYEKNSQDNGSILRKPEERYPIEPNEGAKGKKFINRKYKSRNLC
jgi:hypothetical protein